MIIFEILQNIAYRLNGNDKRYTYYRKLLKNIYCNREQIESIQNVAIVNLIEHAYSQSPYYKELFDKNAIDPKSIKTASDLSKLPELTKRLVKQNVELLKTNDAYGSKLKRITSGGSTGFQAEVYISPYYEQISRAASLRNNTMCGWFPFDKAVWLWGSPIEHLQIQKGYKARIGSLINRRLLLNTYKYDSREFPVWFDKICKYGPKVIYGYASTLLEFSKFLLENKLYAPSIKVVVSTTEKLQERETIASAFRCHVVDQYGCREVLAVGIEEKPGEMLITDDVVVVSVNKQSEILLTALYSYGFPLINYKVGDTAEIVSEQGAISNEPFRKMHLKIGRITDNFLTYEGKTVSSSAFSVYLSTLRLEIQQHQIVQRDYKNFIINYIPEEYTSRDNYAKKMNMALEEYFGENLLVAYNKVDKIPIEKSGKRLMFKRAFKLDS